MSFILEDGHESDTFETYLGRGVKRISISKHDKHAEVNTVDVLENDTNDIPDTFDAREAFPKCAEVIGRIRDQSDCGSCWAFASTEAFNDRRCVAAIGGGKDVREQEDMLVELSVEDTTACCSWFHCGMR